MQLKNRMKSLGMFLLFTVLLIFGHAPDVQAEEPIYLFGLAPLYEKQVVEEGFTPLVNYLAKVVKSPVKLVTTGSYEELIGKIMSNEVQFAILGPAQYVETKWRYPELVYLATIQTTQQEQQRAYYFGNIIVHKDSGITELLQLENMSFSFIDPYSTSGYRFPRMHLYKKGIKPENFFSKVIFAGTHEKGTDLLAAGEVDAVATWDMSLWAAEKKYGKIFKSVARIGPIVQLAVVANHTIPHEISKAVKNALVAMRSEELSERCPYTGFQSLSDKSYDNVREIFNFPFLDNYVPNLLNAAVKSHDVNQIFTAFDELNYQKAVTREFIENELQGEAVTVTGNMTGMVEDIYYGDGWYLLKKAFVLSLDKGRRVYVKTKDMATQLKSGETVTLRGKIIGIKDFDNLVLERVD